MSFLFATEVELGYDSKVTLYRDGDVDQYTYEMPQQDVPSGLQFYRTIKPIAEYLTNSITGRMCRIWLVAAVNSPTDPNPIGEVKKCILKDVWPETKAQTELQLQSLIFKDIEDAFSEIEDSRKEADAGSLHAEDAQFVKDAWEVDANTKALRNKLAQLVKNKGYKKFFLIPVSDFVGECSKATIPGAKRTAGLFITRSTAGTSRPLPSQTSKGHVHRDYIPREQYRIVFDEVCTTVGNLETLGEVVQVLRGTLIPLQLLFCARWVHRDISSGNIMAYREASGTWQAKLSDLEYAKKYPPDGKASGDPKTGTPFFMPVEIMTQHLFADIRESYDLNTYLIVNTEFALAPPENPFAENRVAAVIHNPQHDLESLWWLLLWSITARVGNVQSKEFVETTFVSSMHCSNERMRCLVSGVCFADYLDKRLHAVFPVAMEKMRTTLIGNYLTRPAHLLQHPRSIAIAHTIFDLVLGALRQSSDADWRAMPLNVGG